MTNQGDHVVLKCSGADCGMRYPSPADDPRRDSCPLCESPVAEVDQFVSPPSSLQTRPDENATLIGVLDNVRSALNVGTMMRSADGAALDGLILGGLTAGPGNPKVIKTALGAQKSVPATSELDLVPRLEAMRSDGYEVWAVDFTDRSTSLSSMRARPSRLAFVVGNEVAGVDPAVLALADRHVHLDMHGSKTTLNVGVAFGIVAYWLRGLPIG